MISDEKVRQNLLLAYKISLLYLKSGVSTSTLSKITEIPLSTIKRSVNTIGNRYKDYNRLLPELGSEENLLLLQEAINQAASANKKANKWNKTIITLEQHKEEIEEIKSMYQNSGSKVNEEDRIRAINLRCNGESIRKIASEVGISLGSVHAITIGVKDNKK